MWRALEASLACRQTDRTNVPSAGTTRRRCSCTSPRKVGQLSVPCCSWLILPSCCPCEPCPGVFGHSLPGAALRLLSCVWGLLSLVELVAAETPSPSKSRLRAKFSLYEPEIMCWIIFLSQLSCANQRSGIPFYFPQIIFPFWILLCVSLVFMQGESKTKCSPPPGLWGSYSCEILGAQ